jgi:toxin FitB
MAGRAALAKRPAKKPVPGPMVLDSSCWMEFFADTPRADLFAEVIEEHTVALVVPVITIYEVTKKLAREAGDEVASVALSLMQRGKVVGVDLPLALEAAMNGLPLADSLIYATARHHGAELWTQDSHFECLAGVRYFAKP